MEHPYQSNLGEFKDMLCLKFSNTWT